MDERKTEAVAAALTELLKADHECVQKIFGARVEANGTLLGLDLPFVVSAERNTLGPLGIINGVMTIVGANRVAASYSDDGYLSGFVPCDEHGKPMFREDR